MGAVRSIHGLADRHVTIDRDDDLYQAYADVALSDDGRMICVWREAAGHPSGSWARLVFRESTDLGRTWGERRVLADESTCHWAMPRINKLPDGTLLIATLRGSATRAPVSCSAARTEGVPGASRSRSRSPASRGAGWCSSPDGTLLLPLVEAHPAAAPRLAPAPPGGAVGLDRRRPRVAVPGGGGGELGAFAQRGADRAARRRHPGVPHARGLVHPLPLLPSATPTTTGTPGTNRRRPGCSWRSPTPTC